MAKWTASQFGVSSKGVSDIKGTDYKRSAGGGDDKATKAGETSWGNSSATQSGQTSMGDSRATKG